MQYHLKSLAKAVAVVAVVVATIGGPLAEMFADAAAKEGLGFGALSAAAAAAEAEAAPVAVAVTSALFVPIADGAMGDWLPLGV